MSTNGSAKPRFSSPLHAIVKKLELEEEIDAKRAEAERLMKSADEDDRLLAAIEDSLDSLGGAIGLCGENGPHRILVGRKLVTLTPTILGNLEIDVVTIPTTLPALEQWPAATYAEAAS